MSFTMDARHEGQIIVLTPQGRIDHNHADAFQAALEPYLQNCRTAGQAVLLDFSGIDYISSVGLRVLMLAARKAKAQEGKIAISQLTPVVKEVFEISRFNQVLTVYASLDEAFTALR